MIFEGSNKILPHIDRIEAPKKGKVKSIFTIEFFIIWIVQIVVLLYFWWPFMF
jgi:hypothetical protein